MDTVVTLDQVRAAQRRDQQAPETRALQRAYDHAKRDAERARQAAVRRARHEHIRQYAAERSEAIRHAGDRAQVPNGYHLRAITVHRAQDLMMAPAVAGGWIAVSLPRITMQGQSYLAALLPPSMDYGFSVTPSNLAHQWADDLPGHCRALDDLDESYDLGDTMTRFLRTLTPAA